MKTIEKNLRIKKREKDMEQIMKVVNIINYFVNPFTIFSTIIMILYLINFEHFPTHIAITVATITSIIIYNTYKWFATSNTKKKIYGTIITIMLISLCIMFPPLILILGILFLGILYVKS